MWTEFAASTYAMSPPNLSTAQVSRRWSAVFPAARSATARGAAALPVWKSVSSSFPAVLSCRTRYPSPTRAGPDGTVNDFFAVRSYTPAAPVVPQFQ